MRSLRTEKLTHTVLCVLLTLLRTMAELLFLKQLQLLYRSSPGSRIVKLLIFVSQPSLGGVHRGSCSEDIHMEEEEVQLKVQVEEQEIGETHGREQSEEQRVKERTTAQRG